jgi:hypothetical protein
MPSLRACVPDWAIEVAVKCEVRGCEGEIKASKSLVYSTPSQSQGTATSSDTQIKYRYTTPHSAMWHQCISISAPSRIVVHCAAMAVR